MSPSAFHAAPFLGSRARLQSERGAATPRRPRATPTASGSARVAVAATAAALALGLGSAHAGVNPEALGRVSAGARVVDLERVLTSGEVARLASELEALDGTGVRVRVLTQGQGTAPGVAVRDFFGLSTDSVLVVVDTRGGNVLNFNVGADVYKTLPQSFWVELGNRFGNKFVVQDIGVDGAVFETVKAIAECARPGRAMCRNVPGVSTDQLWVSISSAAVAGTIAGAALRTGKKRFNVTYLLLFSPLWSIFLVSFGVGPVLARESALSMEFAATMGIFIACAAAIWRWIPVRFDEPVDGNDFDL